MNEVQFSIAYRGQFLFRTDWETDPARIQLTQDQMQLNFHYAAGYTISRRERSLSSLCSDISVRA